MNIGKEIGQFNINGVEKSLNQPSAKILLNQNDKFQRGLYVTAPKRTYAPDKSNISLNNLYSSNQLLNAYSDPQYVKFLINTNPELQEILKENGLDGKVYPKNISKTSKPHITSTTAYAMQIADNMNISAADKKILEQACVFHDFGKILIPDNILNKPAALNQDEKKIMKLHSEFGYQLLSNTGMNDKVLDLVKNHHNCNADSSELLQILNAADIYSALREERSYKHSMSEKAALSVLDTKVANGELKEDVVNALKTSLVKSAYTAA